MLKTFKNGLVFLAKTKIGALKTIRLMLLFCILVIRNCFEFRISSFEFVILFILGVLGVFARVIFFPIL